MPIEISNIAQLGSLEFLARQIVEGFITGMHKSPFHGFSVEFAEHRLYNTGEPTRNIDWKLYAKTEKLFVKRYEEETNLRCQIVIDKSSSMHFPVQHHLDIEHPNKLWFSVYSSAALIELMRRQRDAVGLSVFDEEIRLHTPAKLSRVHSNMIYNELDKYQDSIEIIEEAFRNNVKKPILYCLYGEALAKTGNKLDAITNFNKAIELDENIAEAYAGIGFIFCEENNHQSAIKFLKRAHQLAPYNTDYLFVLIEEHNKIEKYKTSLKYLKEIEDIFPYDVN